MPSHWSNTALKPGQCRKSGSLLDFDAFMVWSPASCSDQPARLRLRLSTLRKIATDLLSGKLPAIAAQDLSDERLKICEQCSNFTPISRQCSLCGCFMDLKAKLLKSEC